MSNMIDTVYSEMLAQDALKNRIITINTQIDNIEMYKVCYYMDKIKKIDDLNKIEYKNRKPIEIKICVSPGGEIASGNVLIGKMEQFKKIGYTIITTVEGMAASMAFMILIHGSIRRASEYATIMCHQLSRGHFGNYSDIEVDFNECKRIQSVMDKMIINNTKITKKLLKNKTSGKDWYMDSQEALKYNVIDEIL